MKDIATLEAQFSQQEAGETPETYAGYTRELLSLPDSVRQKNPTLFYEFLLRTLDAIRSSWGAGTLTHDDRSQIIRTIEGDWEHPSDEDARTAMLIILGHFTSEPTARQLLHQIASTNSNEKYRDAAAYIGRKITPPMV